MFSLHELGSVQTARDNVDVARTAQGRFLMALSGIRQSGIGRRSQVSIYGRIFKARYAANHPIFEMVRQNGQKWAEILILLMISPHI